MTTNKSKIPVAILTGFPGAGKTTLLNRILTENHGKRIAVIENDFGENSVGNTFALSTDGSIAEMTNGCIRCVAQGGLIHIMEDLTRRRNQFDYLFVETTGLADPVPVAQAFLLDYGLKGNFMLDGVVTVLDANRVASYVDSNSNYREQIALADVILLNKIDLVPAHELDALELHIQALNVTSKILCTRNAAVQLHEVLNFKGFDLEKSFGLEAELLDQLLNLKGSELNRAPSGKPTLLPSEYPFQWIGVFSLDPGTYDLVLSEGPEPTMDVVLLKTDSEQAMSEFADSMARVFSREAVEIQPGGRLFPTGERCRLHLEQGGSKSFTFKIVRAACYALVTQLLPLRFMRLQKNGKVMEPIFLNSSIPDALPIIAWTPST